jgi:pimeloyl-ACP methyl ester carboxylesterase
MRTPEDEIRDIPHETLIVHGREDRVIPVETSLTLLRLIDRAELHVYSHCGHWTQIERSAQFNRLVRDFLAR